MLLAMSEDTIDQVIDQTGEQDSQPVDEQPSVDVDAILAEKQELEEKNRQLYARLKKAEAKKEETNNSVATKTEPDDDLRETVNSLSLAEKKRQFGYQHGLSPEETDAVFRLNPNPTKETLDDPFVKGGISAIRQKTRVEEATPSTGSKTPTFGGKKFTELSLEEQRKHYAEYVKSKTGQ